MLNVRHRHPALWAAVCNGDIRFHEAARVAEACVTAERERAAAATRKVDISGIKDGHCELWGRLDAADGIAFDQALSAVATTMPPEVDLDSRRAAAVGVLARQALGQAELPRAAEIVVRVDAAASEGDVALSPVAAVQGWGAVLTDTLGDVLAGCRVTVRPIIDAQRTSPSDAYQLPPSLRRVLHERWGVDAFPYGSRPARSCQNDHSTPFDHDAEPGHGQTHPDLMAPLSPFAHRAVTHGGFRREQPEPGCVLWTTPHGYRLLTTPAGTVRISRPAVRPHAWWQQEPPDWLDDAPESRPARCPILDRAGPHRRQAGGTICSLTVVVDPGEAQPPLALRYTLAS